MLTRKICMIGDFAVGKTSLVRRYVHSTFSEGYHTTVGVKVDSKLLDLPSGDRLKLVLWDIAGNDRLGSLDRSYLQGASGYLLVADSTRRETLESAIALQGDVEVLLGPRPFVLIANKIDLEAQYQLDRELLGQLASRGWDTLAGSALSGEGVETAFRLLGQRLLAT
ncbi:MAG TPA: GTP-binding protein [Gammaproteobacteria bacterium]|nr:GTP-binding protein [Gammaproteobacteria bacterium]